MARSDQNFEGEKFEMQSQGAASVANSTINRYSAYVPSAASKQLLRPQITHACPAHPDEQIAYFCVTCNCPPICAECVIHGAHRGHDVQNIRKAHPQVLKQMEHLL